ncbi:MAG: hypothetical protein COU08_00910 [Candidatus Harrisonbacteria bacterium CG10_big_fil_rev_8_21_14_0_10_42_17]|uniref:DNA 3'-5' helicase n=1 Tax=Candidatus Harrisonbacteria bacterium CG10_big_fil_rev_8_21_14_0_10_42_17 TaxID=1974584 RepID=A0A2M6WIS9_9BACT|nr:MAG: hypothetical protein COU08_00910 [Candidatus Harrisonbacteria bacterium CG10_big_fil_rev_8_21_14_0_10_42_17]
MSTELNPQQEKAVSHEKGPLLVIAGAGSGKTRTLTSRLIHLLSSGVPPQNVLAITFTNKAAGEMKKRVFSHPGLTHFSLEQSPFVGTFHSFGCKLLREQSSHLGRNPSFSIFDTDDSLRIFKALAQDLGYSRERLNPLKAASVISRAKNELEGPETITSQEVRVLFERYEEVLAESNAFDFDDLIEKLVVLLQTNPSLLAYYRDRYRYVLVDEFQDVNTSQYELVRLLADEHRNLTVVGDDAQSIYRFRGSDFRNFLHFDQDWPDATVVALGQNYRSTQSILAAASGLILHNNNQKHKKLWTDNDPGSPITIAATLSEDDEAMWIVERVTSLLQQSNISPSIGLLYRTNAQSRALEQALIATRIPYVIYGGVRFYDRQEVKDIIAFLRIAHNPLDRAALIRLQKTFPKKIHIPLLEQLPSVSGALSLLELISWFLKKADYHSFLERKFQNADERKENITELISYAETFHDITSFLERVSLLESHDQPRGSLTDKPVHCHLTTIHLAKGLEFDHVFIVGCDEGILPHHRSFTSRDELEEERRLMYVAMTRARQGLSLSFSHLPSRFLYEIPPEHTYFINLKTDSSSHDLPDEEELYIE